MNFSILHIVIFFWLFNPQENLTVKSKNLENWQNLYLLSFMPLQSLIFLALKPLFWHEIGHIIMELQRANPQGKKICVAGHLPCYGI